MNDFPISWQLDPRLAADTIPVAECEERAVLLMNDQRWPWLIVVPKIAMVQELHDLEDEVRQRELDFVINMGRAAGNWFGCDKINIAAIGNIVRQLHIHVIARSSGDANWPGPVWGFGRACPYSKDEAVRLATKLRENVIASSLH